MALIHADFVEETTTTTGTGTLTLAGATTGNRTFSAGIGNGNTCVYAIKSSAGQFESGIGTVGAGTLSRDTLIASSTGSKLNLPAGTHTVYCTFSGEGGSRAYSAAQLATANSWTAQQTFSELKETVYELTGTAIDPANGSIQYKTLTANTTFTEALEAGQSVTLMLNPATYATTWPATVWIGSVASTAPTLIASVYNCIVLFKISTTLYGKYEGRV